MPGVVVRSLPLHLRVEQLSSRWRPKLDPPLAQVPRLKKKLAPPFTSLAVSQSNGGVGPRSYPGDALLPPPAAGCPRCPY